MNGRGNITRTLVNAMFCFGLMVGLAGCRHKPQIAPLPPVLAPVVPEDLPVSDNLPMVEVPQIKLPPVPVASNAKPKRERKKPAPKPVPPPEPVQVASTPPPTPEETAIWFADGGGRGESTDKAGGSGLDCFCRKAVECPFAAKSRGKKGGGQQGKKLLERCPGCLEVRRCRGSEDAGDEGEAIAG